ncbi:heme exporter protein CcmB [Thiomicrorhabdus lithotrophica]|uniref:Heme exporter protein B n=1 Tax=Thiomicrorhabdus lithotrophica TaxID=2949997 RepID=A0ABY8C8C1_9GAMM|nr:heme exporter protein CcmB [Thiomicrorhabdus lithotrophica]WEJ62214.1 heme exporter protein CcmB [Thiomicrorhabdus lithotrophica]
MNSFLSLIKRDLVLAYRGRGEAFNSLIFFGLVILLFPIGISASEKLLAEIAPGLIWIAALLATMVSLDNLFKEDFQDGTLEQWAVSPHSLISFAWARLLSHWIITSVPLIIIAPLFALSLNLPPEAIGVLILSLLLGTPLLTFIGGIGVALTTGLKKSSMLLPLLVLPFYIPVLIFGASAVDVAADGWSAAGQLYILAGLFVLGITLAPFAVATSLKVSVSQ